MDEQQAQEWAAEEVFNLYCAFNGEYNILHNVHCDHRAAELELEFSGTRLVIKQNRDLQSGLGVTGAAVWDGAIVLARYLEKFGTDLGLSKSSRCVDLGSGTGVLGIALSLALGCKDVFITDKGEMLKLMAQNASKNRSSARVEELIWGEALPRWVAEQKVDFVLAADCIYHENLVPPFVKALVDLSEVIECFFAQAYKHFSFELLDKKAMGMPSRGPSRGIGDLEELNMIYDDYKQQIAEVLGW